jgi:hypothetical protein
VLGSTDRLLVVLHHDDRIPLLLQPLERLEEHPVVARVETDRRLVEDVADPPEVRSELGRQADSLGFTAAEGGGGAVEGQVRKTDFSQEGEARA